MISHEFKPDPHGRDVCDQKFDEDGRVEFCGQRRSEHMDETHALKIQLATALQERDAAESRIGDLEGCIREHKDFIQRLLEAAGLCDPTDEDEAVEAVSSLLEQAETAESERDALRTALEEVNALLMSVPPGEDWRAVVREKVVIALFGEAAWQTK